LENDKIQGEALSVEDKVMTSELVNSSCVFRQLTLEAYVSKFRSSPFPELAYDCL